MSNVFSKKKGKRMMKRFQFFIFILSAASLLTACEGDDFETSSGSSASSSTDDNATTTATADDVAADADTDGDVASFTIALNKAALSETVTVDADDDDFIENTTFDETITITFGASGATVAGDSNGYVTVSGNDVTVTNTSTSVVKYVLSGTTTDGFFKLYSSRKQAIVLNGVSIKNPDGAAINNQSKKRTFIVLSDGTQNYLTDGTAYADATDDEDMKACLFSEGQLIFSGSGYLEVDGNCKAGIRSDDYVRTMPGTNIYVDVSSGNGIRGNDGVIITGGVVNVNVTGTADKGISTDGGVNIDGGRTTIITSGGYELDEEDEDWSACAGIKADVSVTVTSGEVNLKSSGIGGKGISSDGTFDMSGGTVRIITTGQGKTSGSYSTSPKGIKADDNLTVTGGHIQVRSSYSEGIESKGVITIDGGTIESYCYDDAINSKGNMYLNGGYIYARGTNNDAIDSNQNLYITGGVIIAEGAGSPECGIDAAEGYTAYINGGTVVAIGGGLQEIASSSTQASVTASVSTNTTLGLVNGSTAILAYTTPSGNTGSALMISSPSLKSGSTYTLRGGCTLTGGSTFYSLRTGCAIGGGSQSVDVTASTSVSGSMGGGAMGGQGRPGGR